MERYFQHTNVLPWMETDMPAAPTAPVAARDVSLRVGEGHPALRGISLEARAGALTAVIGPEGAGKTSLLHVLAGLDRPTSGSVSLAGRTLGLLDEREAMRLRREHVGLLLREAPALPTITVRENIALPLMISCRQPAPEEIDALLTRVGLGDRRHDRPGELTAAERRRVALARALLGRPSVLLADEPVLDLAPEDSGALLRLLRQAAHEDNIAVVVFTRDIAVAAAADRIVRLDGGRMTAVADAYVA
jgi:putative ABC transport system ATP-binding protein